MSKSDTEGSGPQHLGLRSWRFVVRSAIRKFADDGGGDIAAALTFHAVLALVPSLLVGISVISLLGSESTPVSFVLEVVRAVAPDDTADTVGRVIDQLAESSIAGFALVFGIGLTIWAVARYIAALGRGMNRAYEIEEGRSLWALKTMQLLVALVILVATAVCIAVLAAGGPVARAIGDALSLGDTALLIWRIARWPVLVVIVIACVAFLYDRAPNVRQPRFRWLSWGAVVAIVLLAAASALFGLYVAHVADYERIYGPLAGAIVFLLWLWIANLALVLGVEFDAALERARELQAGQAAETRPQLPLRDRSKVIAKQARRTAEVIEARRLRQH